MVKEDAEKISVPHLCLPSNGEPPEMIKAYEEILGENGEVETYPTMHHGWMGARAKLDDEANAREYERG